MGERVKRQIFGVDNIESICRQQIKCDQINEVYSLNGRKCCGKWRKCWLPAFSPFPTMFSKGFILRVVKTKECVSKG